jgi:hypothetical protein
VNDLLADTGATFSPCRTWRYRLWRTWGRRPSLAFVMLNPSVADEVENDPTVERCQRRAVAGGYGGVTVVNLFALRSTDPKALYRHADPVGPGNDAEILDVARQAGRVVCAWGAHGKLRGRGARVLALLREAGVEPHALRIGKDGQPGHPLYLPYALEPAPMAEGSPDMAMASPTRGLPVVEVAS